MGIMKEGKMVMQRTREELAHEDLEKLYLGYTEAGLTVYSAGFAF